MKVLTFALATMGSMLAAAPAAMAQEYPAKTVRLLVTLPAGSSSDIVARVVGENLYAVDSVVRTFCRYAPH